MSVRLRNLREESDAMQDLGGDAARIAWLNRKSCPKEGFSDQRSWAKLLSRLAANVAARDGLNLVDAWFKAAHALAAAVADPDDSLAGIDLAAYARTCRVAYKYPNGYVGLFAEYLRIYPEWKTAESEVEPLSRDADFHGFVLDRLDELRIGIVAGLPNSELIPPEISSDAKAVASSALLLWDVVSFHEVFRRQYQLPPLSSEDVQALVLDGGSFLWACHHAHAHGIGRDELTEFVSVCGKDWFRLMEELHARNLLRPGVLAALVGCNADTRRVVAEGVNLIAEYLEAKTDMTATEYLNCCLAAVAQDA